MSRSGKPEESSVPARGAPAGAAWECFHRSIGESLDVWPQVLPITDGDDAGDPTVRAMQRARRYTWLHARHALGWSMFESIRISVRLAEDFAEWTRADAPDMGALAGRLEQVEAEARQPTPVSDELRFVDQLMSVATATDLHLADMELAMEAFRKTDTPGRRAASG